MAESRITYGSTPERKWVVERDGEQFQVASIDAPPYTHVEPGFAVRQEIDQARREVDEAHEAALLLEGITADTQAIVDVRSEALQEAAPQAADDVAVGAAV